LVYCMRWLLWCFCLLAESYETINHYITLHYITPLIRFKVANHNEQFYPLFQGRRNSGRSRGSKRVEENDNVKTKKIVTNNACLCSATLLTSKFITEIIHPSDVSECANSCNNYVSSRP